MSEETTDTTNQSVPTETVLEPEAVQEAPASEPVASNEVVPAPETEAKIDSPIDNAPENPPTEQKPSDHPISEPKVEEEVVVEHIGNKTIEKKGDTITITEVIESTKPEVVSRGTLNTKFPAPFKQTDLWQKFLEKLGIRKKKKLDKILQYLDKNQKITNDEVEKLLHVSDATSTRYLDQLEKEGKIKQVGKTGKYTHYVRV